jgi:hypothetical protein
MRAKKRGASRLIFSASLHDTDADGVCADWTCIGGDSYGEDSVGIAHGRTGEEALRHLVEKLEADK